MNIKYKNIKNKGKTHSSNVYINKINYKFKKKPNLKYKLDITNTNTYYGWNDIFEVFISYNDNKKYLISPNSNNYNLDIFTLFDNKKIKSLEGHKKNIRTIRYFINNKNKKYNEYLISADECCIVIIWDITNNYNIKYKIDNNDVTYIFSCLLIFPHNINNNYIIFSILDESNYNHYMHDLYDYHNEKSTTKIHSLNNGKFIKEINQGNNTIFYLLSWYNKKDNIYYIIQFSDKKIIINSLLENDSYFVLKQEPESRHYSGFIYKKYDKDYLCSSSYNGYIHIWDLYNKNIFKIINIKECFLLHIIQWNDKYIIVADADNKSFKIIDVELKRVISDISGEHTDKVKCIKKIYHPIYGESLLSASGDCTIKLWVI